MIKRTLKWITALSLCTLTAFSMCISTLAYNEGDINDTGKCGENVTYVSQYYSTLTLTGTGPTYSYGGSNGSSPFDSKNNRFLIVEEGITEIGDYLFNNCNRLNTVSLPESLTSIGKYAFQSCNRLTRVSVPDNVTTIGSKAFAAISNLKEFSVGEGMKVITPTTLDGLTRVETLYLGAGITEIQTDAFKFCEARKNLKTIYYGGTEEQWAEISQNITERLDGVTVICNHVHTYDSDCDTSCNVCPKDRTGTKPHTFGASCDNTCNLCGALRRTTLASHKYSYGICEYCKECEAVKLVNGKYQIGDMGQLIWYGENGAGYGAEIIADFSIKAKDDPYIDWKPINVDSRGVIEGNGHTIEIYATASNLAGASNDQWGGIFSGNYVTVQNLTLKGNIDCNTTGRVGAVNGDGYGVKLYNILSYVKINNRGTGTTGGLLGYFGQNAQNGSVINNCAVYADITGKGSVGGLVGEGWNGNQYWKITNSAYYGNLSGSKVGAVVGYSQTDGNAYKCIIDNCYYKEGLNSVGAADRAIGTNTSVAASKTSFGNGEITYKLNRGVTDGTQQWYQTIGTDPYPVFDSKTVYYDEYKDEPYTNTQPEIISVDITWSSMSFTYYNSVWNPETHSYGDPVWERAEGGGIISFKNNSNISVFADISYTSLIEGLSGSFTESSLTMAESATATTEFMPTGAPTSDLTATQLGTISVTLSKWTEPIDLTGLSADEIDLKIATFARYDETGVLALKLGTETITRSYLDTIMAPIKERGLSLTHLIIYDVKTVEAECFSEFTGCSSLILPSAVSIGRKAFYSASSLRSIYLPMVKEVGELSFESCTDLRTLELPSCETFGKFTFQGCTSLKRAYLPECTSTVMDMFYDCDSLTEVTFGKVLTLAPIGWVEDSTALNITLTLNAEQENSELCPAVFGVNGTLDGVTFKEIKKAP